MAKLQSATIRLVQKLNRPNKENAFPIYVVVCFKGRKEKATGISCLAKYWDSKRQEIKRSCPNSPVLNKMLYDIKQRIIEKKNNYELNGKTYTPSILLDDSINDLSGKSNEYKILMDSLCSERRLKWKSVDKYKYAYNKLSSFMGKDDFIVDELNIGVIKDFIKYLDNVNDNTKRNILGCIAAVWNYGIQKGICDSRDYPFRDFKFTQRFPFKGREYAIDFSNMMKLRDYFLDLVIDRDGNRWSYKDGVFDRLHKRTSREFGILFFLAMYYMNGSAPIDIALLRVSECERVNIEGVDYWKIEFKRQKSGTSVSVRLKRNMLSIIIFEHFLGFSTSGYVYPIITDGAKSEIQKIRCCNKCGESAIKWVRKAFQDINEQTIKSNVENGLEEPLVDCQKVVLYTARHSFASNYLNSPNATVVGAASLLARSANTIATYIHSLTSSKSIADAVSFLDD